MHHINKDNFLRKTVIGTVKCQYVGIAGSIKTKHEILLEKHLCVQNKIHKFAFYSLI